MLLSIITMIFCFYLLIFHWKSYFVNQIPAASFWSSEIHCEWNKEITENPSGIYELNLCYSTIGIGKGLEKAEPATIMESKIRKNGSGKMLTFEDLSEIPDNEWLPNFDTSVYKLYPQTFPLNVANMLVMQNEPLPEPPINNPRIRYLHVPSKVCPPIDKEYTEKTTTNPPSNGVVIIYKSGVYNFESRNQLRKFYHLDRYDMKIDLVFSIGMPTTMQDNIFRRDGFNVTLRGRAGRKLLEHIQSPQKTFETLRKEMKEHDDLIVGDFEDTYYNLTLKLFHSYQWAARFCRPYNPTFVFIDDDHAVHLKELVTFLKSRTPEELDQLNYGFHRKKNVVFRPLNPFYPQWALSKREIPWPMHVPEYLGIYTLFGYSVVQNIAIGMYFTKPIVIDDTYVAIIMNKLDLPLLKLDGMTFGKIPLKWKYTCDKIMFASLDVFEAHKCSF
ncbi:hypothetical protein ACTXT7_013823 [Hymenolepis weldensis]